ncbi:MAG: hypothetical protein AAB592_03160, partial [Patescibacteria group bacterium]
MPKKAGEFLLDAQLGEKTYLVEQNGADVKPDDAIRLAIEEGAVPATLLREAAKADARSRRISWFSNLDRKFQSLFGVNAKDIAVFFRLMAVMINAGVPLIKSL